MPQISLKDWLAAQLCLYLPRPEQQALAEEMADGITSENRTPASLAFELGRRWERETSCRKAS